MYGGPSGPHRPVYLIFFIKHNNWSTLWYDVHVPSKQYIPLVFQGIDNGANRWQSSDTHYIQAKECCVRTFF